MKTRSGTKVRTTELTQVEKNFNHWIVIFPVKGLPTRPLNNQDLD